MVIVFGGVPQRIPLAEFVTYEQCVAVRDDLIVEMLKSYPDDTATRYYCDAKLTSTTTWQ